MLYKQMRNNLKLALMREGYVYKSSRAQKRFGSLHFMIELFGSRYVPYLQCVSYVRWVGESLPGLLPENYLKGVTGSKSGCYWQLRSLLELACNLDDKSWQNDLVGIIDQEVEQWVMPVNEHIAYREAYQTAVYGDFAGYTAFAPGLVSWRDFLMERDGSVPKYDIPWLF